jgi:steroid 5-alpha reductase family enzyme
MPIESFLPFEAAAILVYVTVAFAVAVRLGRNDIADAAWGPGFIVVALAAASAGTPSPRGLLVLLLVTVWGLRLAFHIGSRQRGKKEDPRYEKWRQNWGRHQLLGAYLQVFLLQGLLMLVISMPVIAVLRIGGPPPGVLDLFGTFLWITGFTFEAAGDRQIARFLADENNRGRIMDQGLWRYTRHPNYFGEVLLWWGIFVIALSVPWGWATVPGPLTITALILFVSGIPLAEAQMSGNTDYQEYSRRTSTFFPLPPKE